MREKLLKILNDLPTGDYIRIRDGKHDHIGFLFIEDYRKLVCNVGNLHRRDYLVDNLIVREGDTLYMVQNITEVKVKPLIYI